MFTLDPLARWTSIVGFSRLALVALLTASATLRPAPGGVTPKEASALFKASAATAIHGLKADLKNLKENLLDSFQSFEVKLKSGVDVITAAAQLKNDCVGIQFNLHSRTSEAVDAIATGAAAALGSLANGTPLDGAFPKDLQAGTGGAYDKALREVRKLVESFYKPFEGRRKRAVQVAEKHGAALTVELRVPNYVDDYSFWDASFAVHANRLGLDMLVAVNRIGFAQDGRLWISGSSQSGIANVTGTVFGAENELDSGTTAPVSGRWELSFTDGGSLFKRGNYIVNVQAVGDTAGIGGFSFSFR